MGGAGDSEHHIKDLFKSRLLRRAPSVYTAISQPSQPVVADGEIIFPDRSLDRFLFFLLPCFPFLFFVFESASSAHITKAQTKLRKPQL